MRRDTHKVLRMGVLRGRVRGAKGSGMVPTQREVLGRQLASAAGKKIEGSHDECGTGASTRYRRKESNRL